MSMTYLSTEVLAHYPSLQVLYDQCKGGDPANYGLCQNDKGEIAFRKVNEEWFLHESIITLTIVALERYGVDCDFEDIVIYYEFDGKGSSAPDGIRPVIIDLINLQHYVGIAKESLVPTVTTWLDS